MQTRRPAVILLVLLTAVSLAPASEETPAAEAAVERAEAAVKALGGALMKRLTTEMRDGGPAGALRVCSEVAPGVAAEQSKDGLSIRRVSLKARNPADAPDDYERAVLLDWERLHAEGTLPANRIEVSDDGSLLRYMKPIKVAGACLACHGPADALDPSVVEALEERYPDDPATGYAVGDLRGAFSVTVALD